MAKTWNEQVQEAVTTLNNQGIEVVKSTAVRPLPGHSE